MKLIVVNVFLFAIIGLISASVIPRLVYEEPIEVVEGNELSLTRLEDVDTNAGPITNTELSPIRHRRVTCDVLSVSTLWVTPNDSACAIKCLAQRRRGGRCVDGVCKCR